MERLEINAEVWWKTLEDYETTFCHAVGSSSTLEAVAQRLEVSCLKGAPACRRVFA